MSVSDEKDNKEQAENFAFTTDVVTYILSAADCPNKFRDYLDCLIGLADGNVEFDATDKQIERRRKIIKRSNKGSKEYWARDKRRNLLKWQMENDLKLLDHEESKYDSKLRRRPPSHFKLYLVEYVQQVIDKAKQNKFLWDIDKNGAVNDAAQKFIDELRARPKVELEKDYINPPTEVRRNLNSAKSNLAEAKRLLEKYDFELYKDDEALVTLIEQLIAEIRERGFVDLLDMKIFSGIEREPKP